MSYSPPKPTVSPFIRVTSCFSLITIWPLYVGLEGLPEVIGMVLTTLPSRLTVISLELASTVDTWERPTVNFTVRVWVPYTPGRPSTPLKSKDSVTFVPGAQYFSGRKSSRSLPNQCPLIGTNGSAVTLTPDSMAFGSVMPRLNVSETGMPTPTVEPFSGV